MIHIKLMDILKLEDRNIRWLATKAEINYSTLYNFANGKTESINFDVIDKICQALNCPIDDIIESISDINGRKFISRYEFDNYYDNDIKVAEHVSIYDENNYNKKTSD